MSTGTAKAGNSQGADPLAQQLGRLSPIKILRSQKGLSQKQLAEKIGMERTRLVRLEQKPWGELSLSDLEMISGAFGMRIYEMLARFSGANQDSLTDRTQLNMPHFKVDSGKGYRFGSVLEKPGTCFIGTLQIDPQKTLPAPETPKADFIYYLVLEGDLLVTVSGRECRLRQHESFTLDGTKMYEFYNPHQFKETNLLIFSLPAFIQSA